LTVVGLPRGTVTMLFTDIEGSTRLLQELGADRYVRALEDHRRLLRQAMSRNGGVEVEMQGDSFHFAFSDASAAVRAAAEAQRALADHRWESQPIRVRIGIHTGEPLVSGGLYAGLDVHRAARVMSAGHGRQVLLSETTHALVATELPDGLLLRDLGEHRLKDLLAPQRLYQLGEEDFPPLKSLYQTNLPVPPTPFLGRERELHELSALLAEGGVRLLTLTGVGGSGKTRLAIQAAAEVSELYPDGLFWVGLAPLRDPALVMASIARALSAKDELAVHIGSKRLLVLLDNFEQLVVAAPELVELLSPCPELTLLVTSREPLHLSAEREYEVLPLRESDAVSLFHERVRAIGTDIAENGETAEICRRLDHLPLAIELAAARVKVLSPRALLERLEQRLPLLTGGPQDVPARQRTLRATIDWSHELLRAGEQRLFARLAVFAGGCTLEAAETICEAELDTLQSLVDKSLLRHTAERFWMLETIREYAAERLHELDEAPELRQRHADWYLDLAERAHPELRGADQAIWLERLEQDHDNFRSILNLKLSDGESETALRLAGALSRFWIARGYLDESRRWLETCLRSVGMSAARPRALRGLAIVAMEQGDVDRAAGAAEDALALDRTAGDEAGAAQSMGILADVVAFRGDLSRASALYEEAAALALRRGDRLELAITLYNLGHVARLQGDGQTAEDRFEESLAIFRELEDALGQAAVLQSLVEVASERNDHQRAFSLQRVSTRLLKEIQYVSGLISSLDAQAGLMARLGQPRVAARLWGAYRALGKEIGLERAHPLEAAARDELVASVRAALGDEVFEQAWAEGASMTLDEAVDFALEQHSTARQPA
jgi:predicted ATPase/class 3 adenylate cyclase